MKAFRDLHPAILFFYFLSVLFFTMLTLHPVVIAGSLLGSVLFLTLVLPPRKFFLSLLWSLLLFLILFIINPLFGSGGKTLLFYFFDKPITLELVLYSAATACMMVSIINWCRGFAEIFTSDKFLCVFANTAPKLSMVLTVALKTLPGVLRHAESVRQAQKGLESGGVKSVLKTFSAAAAWTLEESLDTASSMEARGYPAKRRTHLSVFDITAFDIAVCCVLAALIVWSFIGGIGFSYYPVVGQIGFEPHYIAILGFMLIPFISECEEEIRWKWLKSRI